MVTPTPQARAIALIALAFLLVNGSLYRLGAAVVLLFGTDTAQQTQSHAISAVVIVIGLLILVAARFTSAVTDGWAQATAQAAQVLACVGVAIVAIALIGSLLHSGQSPYFM